MSNLKIKGPLSGFPEFLPELRRVELQWLDTIRQTFESYGFASIESAAAEKVATIEAKGEDVDKEIYALERLNSRQAKSSSSKAALHFDLTVPLARYVSQNFNELTFPFKRYQIQKVWRGERPQEGRYREFTQCDIDVVDQQQVALLFDAEIPKMIHKVFAKLGVDDIQTHLNNRKIIQGYYMGVGIEDPIQAIRIIDKIDKIGADAVAQLLMDELQLSRSVVDQCLALAQIKTTDCSFIEQIKALGIENEMLTQGLEELEFVMQNLSQVAAGSVCANMSISRGLDYYTGTVYEGKFTSYPDFPTIYAGGRYDNLVGQFFKQKVPGVGMSIGLTRTLLKLYKENRIQLAEQTPTDLLVLNQINNDLSHLIQVAEGLRDRGVNVEVFHVAKKKTKQQIQYANKKGIRYILFVNEQDMQVKDLMTGTQQAFDAEQWFPDRTQSYQTQIIPSHKNSIAPFE